MHALDLLLNRQSYARLTTPEPTEKERTNIIKAGLRAPDHARLTPWRFINVSGEGLNKLSVIFKKAASQSGISEEKAESMPFRAPLIIIGITSVASHFKVPESEQILSTGSAITLMQLAAVAQGYQGIWRTGPMAESSIVKRELGLQNNELITGFLYIGTPMNDLPQKKFYNPEEYVSEL